MPKKLLQNLLRPLDKSSIIYAPRPRLVASCRKIIQEYSGPCLRVRRSSDNAETDIPFCYSYGHRAYIACSNSLKGFCGSGNGFISKWYDQTQSGNDCYQSTAARQPSIVTSGVVDSMVNNVPSIRFIGASVHWMIAGTSDTLWMNNTAYDYHCVYMNTNGSTTFMLSSGTSERYEWHCAATLQRFIHQGTPFSDVSSISLTNAVSIGWARFNGGQVSSRWNGKATGNGTETAVNISTNIYIGTRSTTSLHFTGYMPELVIWGTQTTGTNNILMDPLRRQIELETAKFYGRKVMS